MNASAIQEQLRTFTYTELAVEEYQVFGITIKDPYYLATLAAILMQHYYRRANFGGLLPHDEPNN